MNDKTIFRTSEPEGEEGLPKPVASLTSQTSEAGEEVPFTDYEKAHNHPFTVDYFKLGDAWNDKYGGFTDEISSIEGYFKDKINEGELENSKEAVSEKIRKITKLCGIDKTERITMQIEKLAAYINFLKKTDHIKLNHWKYV